MTNEERWIPVAGYPGYEVSDQGRVRSLDRESRNSLGRIQARKGRVLAQVLAGGTADRRYRACTLYRDGRPKQITVHVLVLESFIGPRPDGTQSCHRDDDPENNALENLYWGTPSENGKDKVANGRCWKSNITHCPQGHEYTEENTYKIPSTGHRQCLACIKAKNKGNANGDKTRCPQGHPYDEENTYWRSTGGRSCKACTRDRSREYQRVKRRGLV